MWWCRESCLQTSVCPSLDFHLEGFAAYLLFQNKLLKILWVSKLVAWSTFKWKDSRRRLAQVLETDLGPRACRWNTAEPRSLV